MHVDMLHHLDTLDHAVSSIKKTDEKPNFVFMPDAFHDKNPFKIYTLEFSMSKRISDFFFSLTAQYYRRFCLIFFVPFIKVESV
jgi:hypothetical protein